MSKELTPLEHLQFIRQYEINDEHRTINDNYACRKSLDIIETALKELNELKDKMGITDVVKEDFFRLWKEHEALEVIKVLFKDRARLYIRNDGIEQTIDKNGNYHKAHCVAYVLEFYVGDVHYEFRLHREEYDLLKEVLL